MQCSVLWKNLKCFSAGGCGLLMFKLSPVGEELMSQRHWECAMSGIYSIRVKVVSRKEECPRVQCHLVIPSHLGKSIHPQSPIRWQAGAVPVLSAFNESADLSQMERLSGVSVVTSILQRAAG